jgi:hypothetical protein
MNEIEMKEVLIACRRNYSTDPGSIAQSSADRPDHHCDSKTAYLMPTSNSTCLSYRCKKCGHVWVTSIGGQASI